MNKIWIVSAFSEPPYTGNPAGVMVIDDFPKDAQAIATEMNLSETAFVKPMSENRFHIRWMTPTTEVRLCGHATLAAAHILFEKGYATLSKISFDSLSGTLHVSREQDGLVLDFPLQRIGKHLDKRLFEEALGLQEEIVEVFQAYDDVMIVVHNESIVKLLQPDFTKLRNIEARGVIITAPGTEFDIVSRFFAPRIGVNEDPVTGSAHCKLVDYWSRRLKKNEFRAYQVSPQGGTLHIRIQGERVLLKGKAVTIAEKTKDRI